MINEIKFAVVREDPIVEQYVIEKLNPKKILMIASAGCTALSLKSLFPSLSFTLFDLNPNQLKHVENKILALKESNDDQIKDIFNVGQDNAEGLNACGKFESLFRAFRNFIFEFICPEEQIKTMFLAENEADSIKNNIYLNKYWPVAFDLFFSDSILLAMFGKDAIQHAAPGSYPRYFQKQLELGLSKVDFKTNYFLHHIFLGYYFDKSDCLPVYLQEKKRIKKIKFDFELLHSDLLNIKNINEFQLVSLSNIFDWMEEENVLKVLKYLDDYLAPGSVIIFRQLNNNKNYLSNFKTLEKDNQLSDKLMFLDRSLFYNKINIIKKI